jgi:hypothetical protein
MGIKKKKKEKEKGSRLGLIISLQMHWLVSRVDSLGVVEKLRRFFFFSFFNSLNLILHFF